MEQGPAKERGRQQEPEEERTPGKEGDVDCIKPRPSLLQARPAMPWVPTATLPIVAIGALVVSYLFYARGWPPYVKGERIQWYYDTDRLGDHWWALLGASAAFGSSIVAVALAAVASVRFRNRVRWRRPFTAARWRGFWTLLAVVCTGTAAFLLPLPFFRRVRCFLSFEPSGRPGFRFDDVTIAGGCEARGDR